MKNSLGIPTADFVVSNNKNSILDFDFIIFFVGGCRSIHAKT